MTIARLQVPTIRPPGPDLNAEPWILRQAVLADQRRVLPDGDVRDQMLAVRPYRANQMLEPEACRVVPHRRQHLPGQAGALQVRRDGNLQRRDQVRLAPDPAIAR
jgi:hypothetical protein